MWKARRAGALRSRGCALGVVRTEARRCVVRAPRALAAAAGCFICCALLAGGARGAVVRREPSAALRAVGGQIRVAPTVVQRGAPRRHRGDGGVKPEIPTPTLSDRGCKLAPEVGAVLGLHLCVCSERSPHRQKKSQLKNALSPVVCGPLAWQSPLVILPRWCTFGLPSAKALKKEETVCIRRTAWPSSSEDFGAGRNGLPSCAAHNLRSAGLPLAAVNNSASGKTNIPYYAPRQLGNVRKGEMGRRLSPDPCGSCPAVW